MEKLYLTHYTEYPIYEAAEGGYYYAGTNADDCIEISDFSGLSNAEILDAVAKFLGSEITCYRRGESGFYCDGNGHIGSGDFWVLETNYGENTYGPVAYC